MTNDELEHLEVNTDDVASYSRLQIPDFQMKFKNCSNRIIINDVPYVTAEDRAIFKDIIMTSYSDDVLSSVPQCSCGMTKGGRMKDSICSHCHGPVVSPTNQHINQNVWFIAPPSIRAFIVPYIWLGITNVLNLRGYNLLVWLTDRSSVPPDNITKETQKRITYLESINWPRGLNNFIKNFDAFIELLPILSKRKGKVYADFLKEKKDKIFTSYLPLPTKSMLIVEHTQVGSFADTKSIVGAINAAKTMADISRPRPVPLNEKQIETRIVSIMCNLVEYYTLSIKDTICSKPGAFRRHVFSASSHFSCRAVITALTGPHKWDEIHIPWAQGLEMFKGHITAELLNKHNYPFLHAYSMSEAHGNVYKPVLSKVFGDLVSYTTDGLGFSALFQRNPTLQRLSKQEKKIPYIKEDLTDRTTSMSPLTTKGHNADFDGDEMNIHLPMDVEQQQKARLTSKEFGIFDNVKIGELSNVVALPEVSVSVIGNYINRSIFNQ